MREGGNQYFCMNELKFFGMASSNTSSDAEIPFSTCSLIERKNDDYPGLWLKGNVVYKGWGDEGKTFKKSEPIKCSLPKSTEIMALNLKVCQPINRQDDTGSQGGNIQLKIENGNGSNCTTNNIVSKTSLNTGSFEKIKDHLVMGGTVEFPLNFISLS